MIRRNILQTLICSGTVLLAIGCGDAGPTSGDAFPADTGTFSESGTALESELGLACESVCETVRECRGGSVTAECTDDCVDGYSVEASDECTEAGIELLNCLSGLGCGISLVDPECAEARVLVGAACPELGLVVERVEDTGGEGLLELEGREWVDSEATEVTEETVETEDDDADTDTVRDPIAIGEIPGARELIEFPWLVVSDDD